MRTKLLTAVSLLLLVPFFAIIPSSQPAPWLLSLLAILAAMVIMSGHGRRRNAGCPVTTIPGPRGWPVLGSLPTVSGALMHQRLAALAGAHGARRLMSFFLGATPVVISSHPDTAREILAGAAFADRPTKAAARELMFCRSIGFAPAGDYWRRLRRIAGAGMLSPRRVASLEGVRRLAADGMVGSAAAQMRASGEVAMRAMLHRASLESMVGSVLGLEGADDAMDEMVKEAYELVGMFNLGDYYTSLWGVLDFHGVAPRCRRLAARVREHFGRVVKERKKKMSGGELHGRDDLLSYMLALPEEERVDDSDVIPVLWETIFRGTDVVAILLEWAMARMALHPDIQSKAQHEIDMVVGSQPITDSDVQNLPFLRGIIKETLRVHPPGPLLSWARLAVHEAHVGKHLVLAGTTAMVNMWAISHDEAIWPDPWAFRPERFVEEDVSVLGSDLRLAPFGSGRRVCPGRMMGLSTAYLWLGRLLQEYTWLPAQPIKLTEHLQLSMEMKKPLLCHALCRR